MKKKILHIQVLPKMSGVQKISYEIFKSLPEDKFEKHILFSVHLDTGDMQECITKFKDIGVNVLLSDNLVREISLKRDYRAFGEIYRLCKKENFDVVHTHSTKPGIIGRIAASMARVPLVIHTVHGVAYHKYVSTLKQVLYYSIECFASFFSSYTTIVNNYYKKYYFYIKRRVVVIPNAIDFSTLPACQNKVVRSSGKVKLLFVGRLDEPKDPLTLIRAVHVLVHKFGKSDISLTIVGDGEFFTDCVDLIEKLELKEYVHVAGWQKNVAKYYSESDIFCASSIYEAFGIMFLEAGYYRLPTVATAVEGIPEVVIDNKTGFLVQPSRPELLAQSIAKLIDDPALRERMGNDAYDWVTTKFSVNETMKKYERLYLGNKLI